MSVCYVSLVNPLHRLHACADGWCQTEHAPVRSPWRRKPSTIHTHSHKPTSTHTIYECHIIWHLKSAKVHLTALDTFNISSTWTCIFCLTLTKWSVGKSNHSRHSAPTHPLHQYLHNKSDVSDFFFLISDRGISSLIMVNTKSQKYVL